MSEHQWTIHRTTRLPWCSVCGTGIVQSTFCGGAPDAPARDLAWYQMAYPRACDAVDEQRAEVRTLRAQLAAVTDERDALARLPRVHPLAWEALVADVQSQDATGDDAESLGAASMRAWDQWVSGGSPILAPEGTTTDAEGRALPVVDGGGE